MKLVKIICGTLVLSLLLLIIALSIIIQSTLFKSLAVKSIEKRFNVLIDCESFGYKIQYPLEMDLVQFAAKSYDKQQMLLMSPRVHLAIRFGSLWKSQVIIESVVFDEASVSVERSMDGEWNWRGLEDADKVAGQDWERTEKFNVPKKKFEPTKIDIDVRQWDFINATVRYYDHTEEPIFQATIPNLQVSIKKSQKSPIYYIRGSTDMSVLNQNKGVFESTLDVLNQTLYFHIDLGGNGIVLNGEATAIYDAFRYKGNLEFHQIDLKQLIPESIEHGEYLLGVLTARSDFVGEGTHPKAIWPKLALHGALDIRQGSVRNTNMILKVFDAVAQIPDLEDLKQALKSERYAYLFSETNMPFDIMKANFEVKSGIFYAEDIEIHHSDYFIDADGGFNGYEQSVDFRARVVLREELSRMMRDLEPSMDKLQNDRGRIIIPFVYRGLWPKATVQPQMDYLSRLFFVSEDKRNDVVLTSRGGEL